MKNDVCKPTIWLKRVNERYATFIVDKKEISVRLNRMPQIAEGVYKVEVFSMFCIVDTNVPVPSGGMEIAII